MDHREAGDVEFRISGLDERRLRRIRPRPRWPWIAVIVAVVAGIGGLPGSTAGDGRGDAGAGAARDPGLVVRGNRVLVLADNSSSMTGSPDRIALRDMQVASLRRQHQVLGETVLTNGWAISAASPSYSFLQPLERALEQQAGVDTVYFIADFAAGDADDNDVEGRQRLVRILREQRVRLYVATAGLPVPADYRQLAVDSGGLVVSAPR